MKFSALVLDLDGTLLDSNKHMKESADEVTLTNDEDGVGVVLERILAE